MTCVYCEKNYKSGGISLHQKYCKANPNREDSSIFTPGDHSRSAKWHEAMKTRKTSNQYAHAEKNGLPKPLRTEAQMRMNAAGRKHAPESKLKISIARKRYLELNPDQVPYKLHHYSKGSSYPEKYFRNVLENNGVPFVEQYQVNLYCLDFAILDQRIDLEIDGSQHYASEKAIQHDKRRNKFLEELGWKIIRVRWDIFRKLPLPERQTFIKDLISDLR